jgi:hypothetical protein
MRLLLSEIKQLDFELFNNSNGLVNEKLTVPIWCELERKLIPFLKKECYKIEFYAAELAEKHGALRPKENEYEFEGTEQEVRDSEEFKKFSELLNNYLNDEKNQVDINFIINKNSFSDLKIVRMPTLLKIVK